jgi:hypothetical protein
MYSFFITANGERIQAIIWGKRGKHIKIKKSQEIKSLKNE